MLAAIALACSMRPAVEAEEVKPALDSGALARLLPAWRPESRAALLEDLNDRGLRGQIPAAKSHSILALERQSAGQLMADLLPVAQLYSRPPISDYRVGAVARGSSGSLYFGANLEVPHQILGFSVHAEQSAVANAFMHGEARLTALAVTAAPCGHCRQFLNEIEDAAGLEILIGGAAPARLAELLPSSFGPQNLGVKERLFGGTKHRLELATRAGDALASAALEAARRSYAPYSHSPSGVAVRTRAASVYSGSYLENVAFNPSLSPLESALVGLVMGGEEPDAITGAVLVELEPAAISQRSATRTVLEAFAPAAKLTILRARRA